MMSILRQRTFLLLTILGTTLSSPVPSSESTLFSCLSNAGLNSISSSSTSYNGDIAAYNQRLQPQPVAVVYPANSNLVAAAVNCARQSGVAVAARSGGHSYASYGLGGFDGSLVIDLSAFKGITVNPASSTVVFGGGVKLGDLALALNNAGRAMPHGVCPFVGVGGHIGLGGFGYAGRMWGLSVDNVVGYDVVLANGTIVRNLTTSVDLDLFWALKGSAPNYGIITFYYTKTYPTPATAINFKYAYYSGTITSSQASSLFLAYQSFGASHAPSYLGITFTMGAAGYVEISGVSYTSQTRFNKIIAPLLNQFPSGYTTSVQSLSWIDSLQALAGNQKLSTMGASDYRDDFFAKSLMTPSATPITSAAINAYMSYLFITQTNCNWFVEVNLYGGANSHINSQSLASSSFAHRDKLLNFQMYASSPTYGNPYPSSGIDFVNGMYESLVGPMRSSWGSTFGAYVNYVDPTLSGDEVKALYWASQYRRLSALKGKYDSQNVFRNPQSIVASS